MQNQNVKVLDDKLLNWHVIEKNPDQKYHPGCVFQSEGTTVFNYGPYDEELYECRTKIYIFNTDYIPANMVKEINEYNISFMKDPNQVYVETN